jgi:hypothetical protein
MRLRRPGINLTILLSGSSGSRYAAPVLTLTSGDSPNVTFTLDLDEDAANGDNLRLQIASNTSFTTNLTTTDHTLLTAEIISGVVDFGLDPLTTGTWYARLKHETSSWSNTVTMNIVADTGEPYGLLLILTKP